MIDKKLNQAKNIKTNSDIAVLLIDMQPEFINEIAQEEITKIWNAQKEIIRYCIANEMLLVHIEFAPDKKIKDNTNITIELKEELSRTHNLISFTKYSCNAFEFPDNTKYLKNILLDKGIREVFLTGIYASVCVLDSAEGAKDSFRVSTADTVIMDDESRKRELKKMANCREKSGRYTSIHSQKETFEKPYNKYPTHSEFLRDMFSKRGITYYNTHKEFIEYLNNN